MYICICNALTDRRLKEAIAANPGQCAEEVHEACGCRAKCGKCVTVIKEMLQNHGASFEAMSQAAQ
jgi:bacterioferritin-associated ferredoxin